MDCQVKHVDLRHSSWFFWWCVFLAYPDCTQIDFRKKKTQNVQSFLQIGSKTKVGGLKYKSDQISIDASQSSCSFVSLEQHQIYRDRRADKSSFCSDLRDKSESPAVWTRPDWPDDLFTFPQKSLKYDRMNCNKFGETLTFILCHKNINYMCSEVVN